MEYTKIKQLPGLMIAFDFEKDFDSLSWSFMFKALNGNDGLTAEFYKGFWSLLGQQLTNSFNLIFFQAFYNL